MPFFGDIGNTLRALRVHLFGKGILTLGVWAVGAAAVMLQMPVLMAVVLPVVAIGGVVLTTVDRFYRESQYKASMVDLYRDDLAQQFGIAPEEVTKAHLTEAAKTNDVIGQALTRQRNKSYIAIGTAVLSAASTYLLVDMFGATSVLKRAAIEVVGDTAAASLVNLIGIGTVAGISSLLFQGGLQTAITATSGVGKAAAHDRIMEMEFTLGRGRNVTKEQVYGVMVAGDAKLQHAIAHKFHKPYSHMNRHEQAAVIERVGVAQEMQSLATQINQGDIRPGRLAYMLQDAAAVVRPARAAAEPASASNFVERLGLAPKQNQSYRAQIDAQRSQMSEQGAAR